MNLKLLLSLLASFPVAIVAQEPPSTTAANLALVAKASTSFVSGHETLGALNDGSNPAHSDDKSRGAIKVVVRP